MKLQFQLEHTIFVPEDFSWVAFPQVALAGRSNVGKSSLINCLAERKNLARTSSTPGKTESLNFYLEKTKNFYLVDLPGYGYARKSKTARKAWAKLIESYFNSRSGPEAVMLILDCRLPPQANDLEMLDFLRGVDNKIIPVLTKADKCSQKERNERLFAWSGIIGPDIPMNIFSSKTGMGKDELLEAIFRVVRQD